MRLLVKGEPASFATAREKIWKQVLNSTISPYKGKHMYTGIALKFILLEDKFTDLDNLVEPVLAVLVGKKKYFSGRRPNIQWWYAEKTTDRQTGVKLELSNSVPCIKGWGIFSGAYTGLFPKSATSEELPQWLIAQGFQKRIHQTFGIHLVFPQKVNIGDIATGVVKSTIDCLWPVIGGKPGAPEDWRIVEILVEKSPYCAENRIEIKIYAK